MPADFWDSESGAEGATSDTTPVRASGLAPEQAPEHAPSHPPERAEDAPEEDHDAGEPLRQAFAELQRLFPGRVIEVVAPPPETDGAFDDASASSADEAPAADDETHDDRDDKAQPAISFVPEPSDD